MVDVAENSKSLRSPSTTTFAFASAGAGSRRRSRATSVACWSRWTSEAAGRLVPRPNSGSSPPLELKWLAMTKTVWPRKRELARQRLAAVRPRPRWPGRCGPGERTAAAAGCVPVVTAVAAWSEVPPGAVDEGQRRGRCGTGRPRGCCRRAAPPSWSLTGSICRQAYVGPPAARDRVDQLVHRLVGGDHAVVGGAVVVLDLLERQRCRATCRLSTIAYRARASNLVCGSVGARFSTLNVATDSSLRVRLSCVDLALQAAADQGRRHARQQRRSCRSCSRRRRPWPRRTSRRRWPAGSRATSVGASTIRSGLGSFAC